MHHRYVETTIGKPAAGKALTFTPDNSNPWRITYAQSSLTTDATTGNRYPIVLIKNRSGDIFWESSNYQDITPSSTGGIVLDGVGGISGSPATNNYGNAYIRAPRLWFPGGYSVTFEGIVGTADQWSLANVSFLVCEDWEDRELVLVLGHLNGQAVNAS